MITQTERIAFNMWWCSRFVCSYTYKYSWDITSTKKVKYTLYYPIQQLKIQIFFLLISTPFLYMDVTVSAQEHMFIFFHTDLFTIKV